MRPAKASPMAAASPKNDPAPMMRIGTRSAIQPANKAIVAAPAASPPKEKETSWALKPFSIQYGIRWTLVPPWAIPDKTKASSSLHMAPVLNASRTVQDVSSVTGIAVCPGTPPRLAAGGPPSNSRPMSAGCRRRNIAERGTDSAMNTTAITTQVERQPMWSSSNWVMGRKNTPPMPSPVAANAKAIPRFRWNHLATGTEVIMFWGAARPVMPRTPNIAITCQGEPARLKTIKATPMIAAETGISTLGP